MHTRISKVSHMWMLPPLLGFVLLLAFVHLHHQAEVSPVFLTGIMLYVLFILLFMFYFLKKNNDIQKQLYEQSMHDQLTGLKNMNYLKARMQELIAQAKRKGNISLGVVFFDLDGFKEVNDRFGHLAGDEILKKSADFLIKNTRKEETLARYGGDEFILLLPNSSYREVREAAERLRCELAEKEFEVESGEKVSLQISGGIAVYPEDGKTVDELLATADQNLYRAKKVGGRVCGLRDDYREVEEAAHSLAIRQSNKYLDKIGKKSTQLYLLAKAGNIEVIRQTIDRDKRFMVEGSDEVNSFEFIYLIEGEILHMEEEETLSPGDFITTSSLTEEVYFKTLNSVELLYITNIPVFNNQQKQIRRLISLSNEVARKDQQTEEHCERLQELAMRTGEELGLDEEDLFALVYAAYLHDIGKVNVPTSVLRKEGKLSEEEWELIRNHPVWGQKLILDRLRSDLFEKVASIVRQHHERFDGKGYPEGLEGDEILLEAQILSIADAYDAMYSERPYQKKLPRIEVRKRIEEEAGKQFAPRVVSAFLRAEEELYSSKDTA